MLLPVRGVAGTDSRGPEIDPVLNEVNAMFCIKKSFNWVWKSKVFAVAIMREPLRDELFNYLYFSAI